MSENTTHPPGATEAAEAFNQDVMRKALAQIAARVEPGDPSLPTDPYDNGAWRNAWYQQVQRRQNIARDALDAADPNLTAQPLTPPTSTAPAATPSDKDDEARGRVTWHSTGEDEGPDVGLSMGLGKGVLYVGEITSDCHAEGGEEAAALGDDCGWWLTLRGIPLGRFVSVEAGREFFDVLEGLVRPAASPAPAGASEAEKNLFYPPEVLATDPAPHIGLEGREAAEASIRAEKVRHALNGCDAWNESLIVGTVSGERSLLHIAKTLAAEVRRLQALPTTAPSGGEAVLREAAAQLCERAGATVHWEAFEDEERATRLRVCEERRHQWGSDDECEHDGMCAECGQDMAEHHETDASKAVRKVCRKLAAAIRALALPAPAPDGRDGEVERLREALANLVADVDALIGSSGGVYGLHLNGDVAPWEELCRGGRFEEWLTRLEDARAAIAPSSEERR
ncbi:hypothetical protein [Roseomonas xinghualingensis]|uniref:hypothetical protein n=1 Tax=Roseomonas xinghualingensis TaxID=2986475 RepID=UPI0036712C0B